MIRAADVRPSINHCEMFHFHQLIPELFRFQSPLKEQMNMSGISRFHLQCIDGSSMVLFLSFFNVPLCSNSATCLRDKSKQRSQIRHGTV